MKNLKAGKLVVMLGLLWGISPALFNHIQPNDYAGGNSRDEYQRGLRNTSAAAQMLGGLRTSVSDIMFLKIETYMHEGVGYEPHITEVESVSALIESAETQSTDPAVAEGHGDADAGHEHGEHCAHGHDSHDGPDGEKLFAGETTIPSAEKDYRGYIGNLYRQVKPWSGAALHKHSKGEELLPWFMVMTISDPHYIRGYTIGSFWLAQTDVDGALKFIDQGAVNNPDSFEVHLMYGQLLYKKAQRLRGTSGDPDLPFAHSFIQKSITHFSRSADLAVHIRPPEGLDGNSSWTAMQEQDAWTAVGMSVVMESKYGDPELAKQRALHFKAVLGSTPTFEHVIHPVESFVPSYFK